MQTELSKTKPQVINSYAAEEAGGKLKAYAYTVGGLSYREVEIDVDYCGICHSDVSMLNNDWGMTQFPFVGGHEVVGRISKVGEGVTQFKSGDLVGLGWHAGYCMECSTCLGGDHNLCGHAESTIVGRHGGFADKVRAQEYSVVKLPERIDLESAGPLFCGGITVFNPLVQFDVKPTDRVAVIGIGGLGHLALQFYRAWGCDVTAFTSSESKKEEVLRMGATDTINSRDLKEVAKHAGRFDFVLSTVNVSFNWAIYMSTLKPKGRFHFVGAVLEPLSIPAMPMIMGQNSISGSPVGAPSVIASMLQFAQRHDIKPQIELFKMSEVNEAIARLESGNVRYRAVLKRD